MSLLKNEEEVLLLIAPEELGVSSRYIYNNSSFGTHATASAVKRLLACGRIRRKHGLKGEVKIVINDGSPLPSDKYGFPSVKEIRKRAEKLVSDDPPGVYFLLRKGGIAYIGSSLSPKNRIQTHIFKKKISFDSFFIVKCGDLEVRDLEDEYIKYYQPIENKIGK